MGGQLTGITDGTPVAEATQCLTDTFTITNQENLPVICGINSGYHVYFGKFHLCLFLTTCYLDLAHGIQRPIPKLQKIFTIFSLNLWLDLMWAMYFLAQ